MDGDSATGGAHSAPQVNIFPIMLTHALFSVEKCILLTTYMLVHCRALTLMKLRLKGAQKGHSLLKKKADALTVRFRQILKKIIEVRS